jgi:clan AA aspartic protease
MGVVYAKINGPTASGGPLLTSGIALKGCTFSALITLKNARDVGNVRHGLIKETELREMTVRAMVDTGAITLVINDDMRQQLGLGIESACEATLTNDRKEACQLTEPVMIYWKDRMTSCQALVVPGNSEVLLGAMPLEGMDLMVNPVDRELVGVHGDKPVYLIK